jgi:hypothetical protein
MSAIKRATKKAIKVKFVKPDFAFSFWINERCPVCDSRLRSDGKKYNFCPFIRCDYFVELPF